MNTIIPIEVARAYVREVRLNSNKKRDEFVNNIETTISNMILSHFRNVLPPEIFELNDKLRLMVEQIRTISEDTLKSSYKNALDLKHKISIEAILKENCDKIYAKCIGTDEPPHKYTSFIKDEIFKKSVDDYVITQNKLYLEKREANSASIKLINHLLKLSENTNDFLEKLKGYNIEYDSTRIDILYKEHLEAEEKRQLELDASKVDWIGLANKNKDFINSLNLI